jgi:glutamate synthase (NADPH) large chain
MRVCHLDTCPVGVATQNPELRSRFTGKAEFVVNFFEFLAMEVREYLAALGFRSLAEAVGHTELLDMNRAMSHWKADGLDLSPILAPPSVPSGVATSNTERQDHQIDQHFDMKVLPQLQESIASGKATELTLSITNVDQAVGTLLGNEITKVHGAVGLPKDSITLNLNGSAGQSFGAFIPQGLTLSLQGDANDHVGKGLSGGRIIVRPESASNFSAQDNIIAGNVIGYGATSGELFINGQVGERFLVRNSGATAVCEGVGDHALEYMTGGLALILGPTGRNLGAGMSGGAAFVYKLRADRVNADSIKSGELRISSLDQGQLEVVRDLLNKHFQATGSKFAEELLNDFDSSSKEFSSISARDYENVLSIRSKAKAEGVDPDSPEVWEQIMEVTNG